MGRIRMAGIAAMAAVVLGALWGPAAVTAQEAGDPDTVTVTARREVDIEPDIGRVTLGVRSSAETAGQATDELTERARSVISALEAAGFTDEEIDSVNVNLDRRCLRYCRRDDPRDPIFGYVGSAGIRVETLQLDRLGEVIDVGVDAGATGVRNVTFDVVDETDAVKEALRQAMLYAQEKARILAETGGRTLGRALIIVEGGARPPRQYEIAGRVLGAYASGSGGGDASNPFPIEPPTLSASARVQVTFQLN